MTDKMTLEVVNKIFNAVFGRPNTFSLDDLLAKFAFDVRLPQKVYDTTTNEEAWTDSTSAGRYITFDNMKKRDALTGWMVKRREVQNLDDIIKIWNAVNLRTTNRVFESINVAKSDSIYSCENVYNCTDCRGSKNIVYCDGVGGCDFLMSSQRSGSCNFCIRTDDSKNCSNSYNVISCNKAINCLFVQDCFDVYECMFCSHIASKKYCIANMQFEKEEYFAIKKIVIDWIMRS